ncbi:MAG TPA: flavodoxin domain-containing protein, partial [Arenibacter sp.]|nr:flavodoxin domain-containing protein [Arenibacter sp.]
MELRKGLERGPFNDKQAEKLSEALSGLDSGQLYWLSGYFSGLNGSAPAMTGTGTGQETTTPIASAIVETKPEKITILFGSHTGNSEALAQQFALQAQESGIETEVADMAFFKTRDLKNITNLAVIVSTQGLGDPPVQAEDFYNFLHGKKAPDLSHIQFSVLALGDSSYVDFC